MKKQRNIVRFIVLMLTPVVLWSANILTIHSSQSAQAATNASRTKPNAQPALSAVANGKIAFTRDGEIFTMNPDGSDLKQLTLTTAVRPLADGGGGDPRGEALWSPDGTKIVFRVADRGQICVMNADGSNQMCLTPGGESAVSPDWSPDSTQITFTQASGTGSNHRSDIYVMNADGSNQRNLTNSNPGESVSGPSWSPDGMKIAFSHGATHTVRVMNADGSNQRDILNGYSYPKAWSPDGSKLLVGPSGMKGTWVVNPDGSGLTQILVLEGDPLWSPDGSKVAIFTSLCASGISCDDFWRTEVIVANADGSHPTQAIDFDFGLGSGSWSPDGTKIISNGDSGLLVINADGSGLTNVPNGAGGWDPSWQAVALAPPDNNPINDAQFFVRQHYLDFLNREPDADGLAFWTNEITSCGADPQCIEVKRINDSASFFLSIEFQETGYLVYRFYKTSYGDLPNAPVPIRLSDFLPDTKEIGQDVIVKQSGWEQKLESNKQAFAAEFVQRPRFVSAYPTSMSSEQFVDALFANAGVTPSASDRTAAINEFDFGATTNDVGARARALRRVAENSTLASQEFNRAFVLMQYFGYLRRNPDDAPEATLDFNGYNFWLDKLDNFNGNYIDAEMVKAFLSSTEYRSRFGP
jgi:Tol biopolymer transport system component